MRALSSRWNRSFHIFSRRSDDKLPMLDPAQAQNLIRDLSQIRAATFHDDHFEAVVMIQVNVRGRQHLGVCLMLDLDETLRQVRSVMIVDQRERSRDHLILIDIFAN